MDPVTIAVILAGIAGIVALVATEDDPEEISDAVTNEQFLAAIEQVKNEFFISQITAWTIFVLTVLVSYYFHRRGRKQAGETKKNLANNYRDAKKLAVLVACHRGVVRVANGLDNLSFGKNQRCE